MFNLEMNQDINVNHKWQVNYNLMLVQSKGDLNIGYDTYIETLFEHDEVKG